MIKTVQVIEIAQEHTTEKLVAGDLWKIDSIRGFVDLRHVGAIKNVHKDTVIYDLFFIDKTKPNQVQEGVYPQLVVEQLVDEQMNPTNYWIMQVDNIHDIDQGNQWNIIATTNKHYAKVMKIPLIPLEFSQEYHLSGGKITETEIGWWEKSDQSMSWDGYIAIPDKEELAAEKQVKVKTLEEAAGEYAEIHCSYYYVGETDYINLEKAFLAGANWQKEQQQQTDG